MLSFLFLALSVALVVAQVSFDRRATLLSPHILFQLYFIIQLPLNLFLGTNYYLPRFAALSPLTPPLSVMLLGAIILGAQCFFVFALYLIDARPQAVVVGERQWPKTRVNFVCLAFFVLGYGAFFLLIYINGGFAAFSELRELWRTSGLVGQGWVLFPATTMMAVAMCGLLLNNREQFYGRSGFLKLAIVYAIATYPASQLGFRSLVFLPLFQVIYFYHTYIRRIPLSALLASAPILLFAFTILGSLRSIPYNSSFGGPADYLNYLFFYRPDITYTVVLRSMGADITQSAIDHMSTFKDYMLLYPSLFEAVTIPIPSFVWPDKPVPLSVEFSRSVFGIDGGVSPTIVGEGYWHANLIGIGVLMLIAAALHALFRTLERKRSASNSSGLLMLSLYPSLFMMAESFQGYMNGIVLLLLANGVFRLLVSAQSQDQPTQSLKTEAP